MPITSRKSAHAPRPRRAFALAALVLAASAAAAVAVPAPAGAHGTPTPFGRPAYANATAEAGLAGFLHAGWLGDGSTVPNFVEAMGPGACWLDADGDDALDLFLVNGRYHTHKDKNARDPASGFFLSNGDGSFRDAAAAWGADVRGDYMACAAADYDDDGDADLFVGGYGYSTLLRNDGDGFTNVTSVAGVANERCGDFPCWGNSASWLDYDRDGCLDLFVNNFGDYNLSAPTPTNGPQSSPAQKNRLYRSLCDGTFADTTAAAGLVEASHAWSSVASDLNGDGWIDLYVSNDGEPNDYYVNNQDGTFTNTNHATRDPFHGMGTAIGDVNHDGVVDVVTTNFIQEANGIYVSGPIGHVNRGEELPFNDGIPWSGWAAHFFDVNNDGHQDLMVFNSMTESTEVAQQDQPILVYENQDGGTAFEQVNDDLGAAIATNYSARGGAWGDYDNDGDVDVLVMEAGENPAHLLRADRTAGNFLNVDLESLSAGVNRDAIGARVTVEAPGLLPQYQEKYAGSGYLGSNDPRLHFGLGAAEAATVTVRWPDGAVESWSGVRANSFVRLTQGESTVDVVREMPILRVAAPDVAGRLDAVRFVAEVTPAGGSPVASVTWDFADGATASGLDAAHAFTDVGTFTVYATVTDEAGRVKTQAHRVRVEDALALSVTFEKDEFLPVERAAGEVAVAFSNGDPVRDASVSMLVTYTSGDERVDDAVARLPRAVRTTSGYYSVWVNGTTDDDGRFQFEMPYWQRSPAPSIPLAVNQPGTYEALVTGHARGSEAAPTYASYRVAPAP